MNMHALGKDEDKNKSLSKRLVSNKVVIKIHRVFGKGKPVMKRSEKRMRPNKENAQMPYCRV